jgi:hypothetical protein
MFTASETGFVMQFANGWHVSVQWHDGNYCARIAGGENARTAEVGMWRDDEDLEDMTIHGWQSPEQVASLIAWAAGRNA